MVSRAGSQGGGSRADLAYREIRARILDNVWAPGHQVLEAALAIELGISRTPVRAALIRLHDEGLVELISRHGMRVLPLSAQDMRALYEVLTALESAAAELAARRRPAAAELRPLERATRDMARALDADDLDAWAEADARFHRQLVELSGNALLVQAALRYADRVHRARRFTLRLRPRPVASTREHEALVKRIRAGDAAGAAAANRAHRERASRELVEIFERFQLQGI
ncbi:MAG: GntR family transcriptional regulator [Betaproteobacteria bacterium]|jgi:DNA-binding GntR family transcriptional regulator|nr:GntR family transcriptional regulator [Betaproteobacteria bacterium]